MWYVLFLNKFLSILSMYVQVATATLNVATKALAMLISASANTVGKGSIVTNQTANRMTSQDPKPTVWDPCKEQLLNLLYCS